MLVTEPINTQRWEFVHQIPDGHKIFREKSTLRYAVADNSGRMPEDTNDGVLFVDDTKRVSAINSTMQVPVLNADDEPYSVLMTIEGGLWISATMGMEIQSSLFRYKVRVSANQSGF